MVTVLCISSNYAVACIVWFNKCHTLYILFKNGNETSIYLYYKNKSNHTRGVGFSSNNKTYYSNI